MIRNYIKIAFKVMLRKKYYTLLSIIGISSTIMIIMLAAAFIDQVIGNNSTEPNRDVTLTVKEIQLHKKGEVKIETGFGLDFFNRYLKNLKKPKLISVYREGDYFSSQNQVSQSHKLIYTDEIFWKITQFKFLEGQSFNKLHLNNADRVIVITENLRSYYFPGSSALNKEISVMGNSFKIIGVVKSAPVLSNVAADAWVPYTVEDVKDDDKISGDFKANVLTASSNDFENIKGEMNSTLKKGIPASVKFDSITVNPLTALQEFASTDLTSSETNYSAMIFSLTACVILFMLVPAISLVNLNLTRISERSAEIGIRKAFGASVGVLLGQFIIENVLLTFVGSIIGLCLAFVVSDWLIALVNTFDPFYKIESGQFILSWHLFIFCFSCSLFFGLLSGVYPAYKMSKLNPIKVLQGGDL